MIVYKSGKTLTASISTGESKLPASKRLIHFTPKSIAYLKAIGENVINVENNVRSVAAKKRKFN